jgi:predicted ATPase
MSVPTDGRYPPLELSPRRRKELTIEALGRHLLGLARRQPVLMILEDAHWIDPTTLELVDRTIELIGDAPVLMLVTFRPEFFAPWLDRPHVTVLQLARLGRQQAATIIVGITGGKKLPAQIFEHIISKTDGIPLFVEELTKAVLELGVLQEANDRYVFASELPPFAIPSTLQDSLMARLDRLAPVREIAQIGAALGREFSYRLLAAVAPVPGPVLRDALAQLAAAELIFSRGVPPDATYIFKHALVQDVAYDSLLRSKRQLLHSRIADVLKNQLPEVVETQPELMAHHLAGAGLIPPAIEYLRKAGLRAIERSANAEAIGHLQRALSLLRSQPESPGRKREELELEAMLGQAMIAGLGYAAPETRKVLLRAKSLIDETTDLARRFAVLYGLWACYYVSGEVAVQRELAAEFLREAERHGEPASLCIANRALGTTYIQMGNFPAAQRHLERARALYDPNDHPRFIYQYGQDIGCTALCYLSWALWHLGQVEQALDVARQAVERAQALAHPHTLVYTICHARGMIDIFRGCADDTPSYASLVVDLCTEHGFPFWAAGGRILQGWAAMRRGNPEGIERFREGLADWRSTGSRLWLPMFLALEAEAHAREGRRDAALAAVDQAIAMAGQTGERWAMAEVLRIRAALWLDADSAAAEADFLDALRVARDQGARCWELRIATDLARLWSQQGRGEAAREMLESVYAQFTEGFGTPDLRAARALLDELRAHGSRAPDGTSPTADDADAAEPVAVPDRSDASGARG